MSLLKPFSPSTPGPTEPDEPPPPEILDQPSVYQGRDILDSRRQGSRLENLVDWEGYGPEDRSWVVRDDILDPMLLDDFHRTHPNHPTSRGHGHPRRQEPPQEEGVMSEKSRSHSLHHHHSHQSPLTPDHTHLYSDHLHLPISNQVTFMSTLHSVFHCPVYRSLPRTVPDSCALLTCRYLLYL